MEQNARQSMKWRKDATHVLGWRQETANKAPPLTAIQEGIYLSQSKSSTITDGLLRQLIITTTALIYISYKQDILVFMVFVSIIITPGFSCKNTI